LERRGFAAAICATDARLMKDFVLSWRQSISQHNIVPFLEETVLCMSVQNVFMNVNIFCNYDEYKRFVRCWLRVICIMHTWTIKTSSNYAEEFSNRSYYIYLFLHFRNVSPFLLAMAVSAIKSFFNSKVWKGCNFNQCVNFYDAYWLCGVGYKITSVIIKSWFWRAPILPKVVYDCLQVFSPESYISI
jgi:hypothetical protein